MQLYDITGEIGSNLSDALATEEAYMACTKCIPLLNLIGIRVGLRIAGEIGMKPIVPLLKQISDI